MSVNFKTNVTNVPKGKSSNNFGILHPAKFNHYFNDFHEYNADDFEVVKVEGGTSSASLNIIDGDGGVLRIVTDDADDDCVALLLGDGNAFKSSMRFNFDKDWFFKIRAKVSGFTGGNDFIFKAGMGWDLPTGADLIDFVPCVSTYLNAPYGFLQFDQYLQVQTNNAGASGNSSVNLNFAPDQDSTLGGFSGTSPVNLGAGEWNVVEMYYDAKKQKMRTSVNGVITAGMRLGYETSGNSDDNQPVNAGGSGNLFKPAYALQAQRWCVPERTNDSTKYMSPFISIRNQQAGTAKTLDIDYIWCGVEREGAEDLVL